MDRAEEMENRASGRADNDGRFRVWPLREQRDRVTDRVEARLPLVEDVALDVARDGWTVRILQVPARQVAGPARAVERARQLSLSRQRHRVWLGACAPVFV